MLYLNNVVQYMPGNVVFENAKLTDGIMYYPPPFLIVFINQPLTVIIN